MADKTPFALDNYRLLGNSGLRVSPLCLGTMTFGRDWQWGDTKAGSKKQFELYAKQGGNFIDTANLYTEGTSEKYCGEFIAAERQRFVLATKFSFNMRPGDPNSGGNHRKNIIESVDASLKRLNTEYIDLLWLHVWEYRTPVEETMRAVDDLVRMGKVHYFGFSDTPAWKVAEANTLARLMGWTPAIALQIEHSLIERTVEPELYECAKGLGLGVAPWSPLGGGVLTGKYLKNEKGESARAAGNQRRLTKQNNKIAAEVVKIAAETGHTPAQVAINWLLCQPGVTSPILGARNPKQLKDCLGAAAFVLENRLLKRLDKVSAIEAPFPQKFQSNEFVVNRITGNTSVEQR